MKCYASPYEGAEDFLFFSYCHEDASRVYPIIERLAIEGFHAKRDPLRSRLRREIIQKLTSKLFKIIALPCDTCS